MAKKYNLKFPEAEGRYWYLYWRGKIYVENKIFKIDLNFVNKNNPNLDKNDFNDETYIQKINLSNIIDFYTGVIFDSEDRILIKPKEAEKKEIGDENTLYNMKVVVEKDKNYSPTKKKFPLIGNPQFPEVLGLDEENVSYMKYNQRFYNSKKDIYTVYSVIVPFYCLLDYFFFSSSRIINKIFTGRLLLAFKFDKLKIINDSENNKRIAQLPYDNSAVSNNNAKQIVPYLFLKDKLGVQMLESIYSSLYINFNSKQRRAGSQVGAHMNLYFTTDNYELVLRGVHYDYTPENAEENEVHKVFLASKIHSCNFLGKDLFDVDEIVLIPLYPNKTNANKDDINISSYPKPSDEDVTVLNMYPNKPASNSGSVKPDAIKTSQIGPFTIGVKIEPFEGDKKNFINIPLEEELDGLSTEENRGNSFDGLIIFQQKTEKFYNKIMAMDNLEYFARVVDVLKTMGEEKGISINDDPLDIGRENYPYELITEFDNYLIDAVEIQYKGNFLYAVEFGNGFIGIFNDVYSGQIDGQSIRNLLKRLINEDKDQSVRAVELETNKEGEGKRLWTRIYRKYKSGSSHQDIEIKQGVKHPRADESEKKTAFQKTAESILKRFTS